MNTYTQTYTQTNIRKAFENFKADLFMLARKTQAMELDDATKYAHDILLMAQNKCLKNVHVQLYNYFGKLIRVHVYTVTKNLISNSQRPGENKWPCLPDGNLHVVITLSDHLRWEELKKIEQFQIPWSSSSASTDYSGMLSDSGRFYSSGGYGLRRETFINL